MCFAADENIMKMWKMDLMLIHNSSQCCSSSNIGGSIATKNEDNLMSNEVHLCVCKLNPNWNWCWTPYAHLNSMGKIIIVHLSKWELNEKCVCVCTRASAEFFWMSDVCMFYATSQWQLRWNGADANYHDIFLFRWANITAFNVLKTTHSPSTHNHNRNIICIYIFNLLRLSCVYERARAPASCK